MIHKPVCAIKMLIYIQYHTKSSPMEHIMLLVQCNYMHHLLWAGLWGRGVSTANLPNRNLLPTLYPPPTPTHPPRPGKQSIISPVILYVDISYREHHMFMGLPNFISTGSCLHIQKWVDQEYKFSHIKHRSSPSL